ncbi:MAG TPA: alanine dehydrogenase [Sphingomicrobium sp.]|nr:alanine dehydrogenase [Sphingomicrobium sp.]
MIVGVPKEIKKLEFRVGLTPASVREYVAHGHQVLVETGAGSGIGATDEAYLKAGARIAAEASEIFASVDLIVKVKEPLASEWPQLRDGQILFTFLHLAADRAQTDGLLGSGVTAVAYETVVDQEGRLPLLAPMSEVAGRLSIEAAATALKTSTGGRGLLLGGVPGVQPARVVVIGGGVVGTHAARMALGLGAEVSIIDRSIWRLRELEQMFEGRVRTRFSTLAAIEEELRGADAVIGAVLIPGASAPRLVSRDMLSLMPKGSVLVDVAIDQGGCFENSRPTTHDDPTFEIDGIIHYCVANMPGSVPLTSSHALNNATLPYGLQIADGGLAAIRSSRALMQGVNVHRGALTSPAVAESLRMPHCDAEELLAA